jgi:hypothetical protein
MKTSSNKFLFRDKTEFDKLSNLEKKFYELIFLLDATNAPIILMYLYDKFDKKFFDEETFIKFIEAMISLTFRSKLCGTKGITSQFAGNVILKLEKETFLNEDKFWEIITFGKGDYSFPNDEKFKKSLINSDLQATLKSDGCRYLLYSLEKNAEHSKELPKYSGETASIEHIMPRTLNDEWKIDLQQHERWLNTLGNLTLTAYNSELSNFSFKKKQSIYENSGFFYTRELIKFPDWTPNQIQFRAKKLADVALKIWNLPEKYNSVIVENGNVFTLDSDLGNFTGTKPLKISVANDDKEIKNWREFLREIMKTLYTLDKNIFKQIIQRDNVPRGRKLFSSEEQNLCRPIKIDENFYVEDAFDFDTETALRISKSLVENFDLEGNTNFKDDIWFTIKN